MQKYPQISLVGVIALALVAAACATTNPPLSVQTDSAVPAPASAGLQPMHSSVILQRVATAEQRSLYRLATELRFVLNLVRESQAQADARPDARIRFEAHDYGLLIRDLEAEHDRRH